MILPPGKTTRTLLLIIILLGSILRFYYYSEGSLSPEELGILHKVSGKISDSWLLQEENRYNQPMGVPVFLYGWTRVFGNSAASVRFPFLLIGIACIYLVFRLAAAWFNETAGLLAALLMSFSSYTILYSRLALPHVAGMFFVLLSSLYWTKVVFPTGEHLTEEEEYSRYKAYTLSTLAAMYTHYTAFILVSITGITGLFFIRKEKFKEYLLILSVCWLAFLPHSDISIEQVLTIAPDLLARPHKDTLMMYLYYCFNNSEYYFYTVLAVSATALIFGFRKIIFSPFHRFTFTWFALCFLLLYVFSVTREPVLDYSTLLPSFPFMGIFLFSFFPNDSKKHGIVTAILLLPTAVSGLIYGSHFYIKNHTGSVKEIAGFSSSLIDKYKAGNISLVANAADPFYIDYYFGKTGQRTKPLLYNCVSDESLGRLQKITDSVNTPCFIYAWTEIYNPPEAAMIIKHRFPFIAAEKKFGEGGVIVFCRNGNNPGKEPLFRVYNDFEVPLWEKENIIINKDLALSGSHVNMTDSLHEFGPTFTAKTKDLSRGGDNTIISANVRAYGLQPGTKAELVIAFESAGKLHGWYSRKFTFFEEKPGKWFRILTARRIPKNLTADDIVKVYVWNPGKENLILEDMKVEVYGEESLN